MTEKMMVYKAEFNSEQKQLSLFIETNTVLSELEPKEQMLVDSDNFSFVYITEKAEDYTYVVLPESIWGELKKAWNSEAVAVLSDGANLLELPEFFEELRYLVDNIIGNSNYGEEMVAKVEGIFLEDKID